jgi:hypothetical protein
MPQPVRIDQFPRCIAPTQALKGYHTQSALFPALGQAFVSFRSALLSCDEDPPKEREKHENLGVCRTPGDQGWQGLVMRSNADLGRALAK